ncbi:unnamed protein product, partial [Bubo scandiacus]
VDHLLGFSQVSDKMAYCSPEFAHAHWRRRFYTLNKIEQSEMPQLRKTITTANGYFRILEKTGTWILHCLSTRRPSQTQRRPSALATAGGGEERRDKHRVQKDPQGKREWQEERRKSGQQVEEREGRSGQSATVRGGAAT